MVTICCITAGHRPSEQLAHRPSPPAPSHPSILTVEPLLPPQPTSITLQRTTEKPRVNTKGAASSRALPRLRTPDGTGPSGAAPLTPAWGPWCLCRTQRWCWRASPPTCRRACAPPAGRVAAAQFEGGQVSRTHCVVGSLAPAPGWNPAGPPSKLAFGRLRRGGALPMCSCHKRANHVMAPLAPPPGTEVGLGMPDRACGGRRTSVCAYSYVEVILPSSYLTAGLSTCAQTAALNLRLAPGRVSGAQRPARGAPPSSPAPASWRPTDQLLNWEEQWGGLRPGKARNGEVGCWPKEPVFELRASPETAAHQIKRALQSPPFPNFELDATAGRVLTAGWSQTCMLEACGGVSHLLHLPLLSLGAVRSGEVCEHQALGVGKVRAAALLAWLGPPPQHCRTSVPLGSLAHDFSGSAGSYALQEPVRLGAA